MIPELQPAQKATLPPSGPRPEPITARRARWGAMVLLGWTLFACGVIAAWERWQPMAAGCRYQPWDYGCQVDFPAPVQQVSILDFNDTTHPKPGPRDDDDDLAWPSQYAAWHAWSNLWFGLVLQELAPIQLNMQAPFATLEQLQARFASQHQLQPVQQTLAPQTTPAGHRILETVYRSTLGEPVTIRIIRVGYRLYGLIIRGPHATPDHPRVKQFLDSFVIQDETLQQAARQELLREAEEQTLRLAVEQSRNKLKGRQARGLPQPFQVYDADTVQGDRWIEVLSGETSFATYTARTIPGVSGTAMQADFDVYEAAVFLDWNAIESPWTITFWWKPGTTEPYEVCRLPVGTRLVWRDQRVEAGQFIGVLPVRWAQSARLNPQTWIHVTLRYGQDHSLSLFVAGKQIATWPATEPIDELDGMILGLSMQGPIHQDLSLPDGEILPFADREMRSIQIDELLIFKEAIRDDLIPRVMVLTSDR